MIYFPTKIDNYDVRLAVKTNTSAVDVAGGFNGYLAN